MEKFNHNGEMSILLNCIGDDQINLQIAIASSDSEMEHAVIALSCNEELDKYVYLSPLQAERLVGQLESLIRKSKMRNYQLLMGEENPFNK